MAKLIEIKKEIGKIHYHIGKRGRGQGESVKEEKGGGRGGER